MSFIYSILPEYTKSIDIFNDYNNTGEVKTLEGFTNAIETEVFEVLSNSIREIINFSDVYKIKEEYLPYFSYLLGYKWSFYFDTDLQKNIVANIIQLYKRKGTRFSFNFNISQIDPNIELYEPYKDIFVIGKSKLNTEHLPSKNYYSVGVIVIKIQNYTDAIFELLEMVRPAGWKIVVEGRYGLFYNLHIKPYTEMREYFIKDKYTVRDNDNEDQIQYYHSIQFINQDIFPIVMMGNTFMTNLLWTMQDLQYLSIIEPDEDLDFYTMWRNPLQYASYYCGE